MIVFFPLTTKFCNIGLKPTADSYATSFRNYGSMFSELCNISIEEMCPIPNNYMIIQDAQFHTVLNTKTKKNNKQTIDIVLHFITSYIKDITCE